MKISREILNRLKSRNSRSAILLAALVLSVARPSAGADCQPASVRAVRVKFVCPKLDDKDVVQFHVLGKKETAVLKEKGWEAIMPKPPFTMCRDQLTVTINGVPVFCEKNGVLEDGWATYRMECPDISWDLQLDANPQPLYFAIRYIDRTPPRNCQQRRHMRTPGSVCYLGEQEKLEINLQDAAQRNLKPVPLTRRDIDAAPNKVLEKEFEVQGLIRTTDTSQDFIENVPTPIKIKVTLSAK